MMGETRTGHADCTKVKVAAAMGVVVVMVVWGEMDDQRSDVNQSILIQEALSLLCQGHQEQGLIG